MADRNLINLKTILDANIDYYEYSLARYFNDTSIDLRSNWETQWRNIGFDVPSDDDLLRSAYVNVIKSVIDSLVSKLANQKVRPYFTSMNGTWKTKKILRDVQQYFDVLFDNKDIHHKISNAFRSACIMGKGHVFIDPFTYEIKDLCAHEVATLMSEERYSQPKHCAVRYLHFPKRDLANYGIDLKRYSAETVDLLIYIDLIEHKVELYVNGSLMKKETYKPNILPLVTLYYNIPVFGNSTTSVVHELDGIQTQIDYINSQIAAATQLSPANQTFVIEGSNLAPKDLANKAGMVYGIKMPAGVNTPPVVSVAPRPFDPQWLELQKYYIQQAYEVVGISQLSAMSKKPSGLDSGAALQTMEDIESDRFETQVSHYVQSYVDLAKTIIEVLPEDDNILPDSLNTSSLSWKDVKKQSALFKVQYSAATALSKDPAEKVKQILQLSQVGLIGPDKISRYLDMPDLEDAYKDAAAVADGVAECIERAIEEEDYDIPDWVSYQMLAKQITIVENELYSSMTTDKKVNAEVMTSLMRLRQLEENLAAIMEQNGYVQTEQVQEAVTSESGLGIAPEATNVADITADITNEVQPVGSIEAEEANPIEAQNPNGEVVNG